MPIRRSCVVASLVSLVACHHEGDHALSVQAVRVEPVTPVGSQIATMYSGSAFAARQVELSFKVGGYVDALATTKTTQRKPRALQAGDRVSSGTVLAALRESDFKASLAELG